MHLELDPSPNGWTNACSLIQHDTSETGNRHDNPWIHFFSLCLFIVGFHELERNVFFHWRKFRRTALEIAISPGTETWRNHRLRKPQFMAFYGMEKSQNIRRIHIWQHKKRITRPTEQKSWRYPFEMAGHIIVFQSLAQPLLLSPSVGFARETWVSALKHDQFFLGKNKPLMVESLLFSTVCWW